MQERYVQVLSIRIGRWYATRTVRCAVAFYALTCSRNLYHPYFKLRSISYISLNTQGTNGSNAIFKVNEEKQLEIYYN